MATDIAVWVRFRELDGTLILDASEANGYKLATADMPERTYRRVQAKADDVPGHQLVQHVLDSGVYEITFIITGSSGPDHETKRTNLRNAADGFAYLLDVSLDGIRTVWRAEPADFASSSDGVWLRNRQRPVTLRIPVQPNPTTGED